MFVFLSSYFLLKKAGLGPRYPDCLTLHLSSVYKEGPESLHSYGQRLKPNTLPSSSESLWAGAGTPNQGCTQQATGGILCLTREGRGFGEDDGQAHRSRSQLALPRTVVRGRGLGRAGLRLSLSAQHNNSLLPTELAGLS